MINSRLRRVIYVVESRTIEQTPGGSIVLLQAIAVQVEGLFLTP